jgi:hypothetical protein
VTGIVSTVVLGWVNGPILRFHDAAHRDDPLRPGQKRAGHAHAGALLLSLVALR